MHHAAPLSSRLLRPAPRFSTRFRFRFHPTSLASSRRLEHTLAPLDRISQPQIYLSTSSDPFVNLSIEHYLFTRSHPGSSILFLYVNRPCVVIGRNQNPWLEANLPALGSLAATTSLHNGTESTAGETSKVLLARRRSGGGTVFHDAGNLNYCVITPRSAFNRDRSAVMVARALNSLPINHLGGGLNGCGIRVNDRHDIVMDLFASDGDEPSTDPAHVPNTEKPRTVKISGSAYKLTAARALHHGTLLLASPNLSTLAVYLRSPAREFIRAKGVDSVRSDVGNVFNLTKMTLGSIKESMEHVKHAIMAGFLAMCKNRDRYPQNEKSTEEVYVGEELFVGDDPISKTLRFGRKELKSTEWKYLQTPRFTISPPFLSEDDPIEVIKGHIEPDGVPLHTVDDFSPFVRADSTGFESQVLKQLKNLFPAKVGLEE